MKWIVILGDGMADHPVKDLDGKTPLMVARKPGMDVIARNGQTGLLETIGQKLPTGSAVANLAVLGYNPETAFQGRGVLEAASLDIKLNPGDVAMRINLICVDEGKIRSHSAGHISDQDAGILIRDLKKHFKKWPIQIHQGLSYRHVLVIPDGNADLTCYPPHDHVGESISKLMVQANSKDADETATLLNRMIRESQSFLKKHPLNLKRIQNHEQAANMLWPWSPGKKPAMQTFQERFNIKGAVISAVDLIKGLGCYAGLDVIKVEGATGLYDTNYEGKADACLKALEDHDFVYLHVEAADEAGHEKNLDLKIRCIEDLDSRLVQRILDGIQARKLDVAVAILPDHPTPVETGKHARNPVPVAIWHPELKADEVMQYDEESVKKGSLGLMQGDTFIKTLFGR